MEARSPDVDAPATMQLGPVFSPRWPWNRLLKGHVEEFLGGGLGADSKSTALGGRIALWCRREHEGGRRQSDQETDSDRAMPASLLASSLDRLGNQEDSTDAE